MWTNRSLILYLIIDCFLGPNISYYITAIDVLYRLVEEGDVCGKETNHVAKTIAILERILDETTDLHVDGSSIQMLTDAKDLEDMYNSIIGK